MPLGDSITGSPGCWRSILWNRLQSSGHTNIDFMGTLPPQGCGQAHDGDNEGHGGILATNMASQSQLPGWLAATRPDIVMMHLGTNDVWSARSNTAILNAFTTLVAQMRADNPNMKILVAKIIPMNPATCADRTTAATRVVRLPLGLGRDRRGTRSGLRRHLTRRRRPPHGPASRTSTRAGLTSRGSAGRAVPGGGPGRRTSAAPRWRA